MVWLFRKQTAAATPQVSSSLDTIIKGLEKLCAGDRTARIEVPPSDPLFVLADLINKWAEKTTADLSEMTLRLNEAVYAGVNAGIRLNYLSDQFRSMTASFEQISTAVAELTASVTNLAQSANETAEQAQAGKESMDQTNNSVQTVAAETQKSQHQLEVLSQRINDMVNATAKIDDLVSVVKGVSDQTNLLALNAAIEAARAGEYGRGFAVVAQEVRKLADLSRNSVGEITQQLGAIRKAVEQINKAFEDMGESFKSNFTAVKDANMSTDRLTVVFDRIGTAVQNLAPIAQEQSATFEEISATVSDVTDRVVKLNEMAQACNKDIMQVLQDNNDLRVKLASSNLSFTPAQIIDLAKTDHLIWKMRIMYMLQGLYSPDSSASVPDYHACRLGKWYYGAGEKAYGHLSVFKELGRLHAEFHRLCAEAIENYQKGDYQAAQQQTAEIDKLSSKITLLLDEFKSVEQANRKNAS